MSGLEELLGLPPIPQARPRRQDVPPSRVRDLPSTYFEAKPRRAVPLSEFRGAVVPEYAAEHVGPLLARHGVEMSPYATRSGADVRELREARREAFGRMAPWFFTAPVAGLLQRGNEEGARP